MAGSARSVIGTADSVSMLSSSGSIKSSYAMRQITDTVGVAPITREANFSDKNRRRTLAVICVAVSIPTIIVIVLGAVALSSDLNTEAGILVTKTALEFSIGVRRIVSSLQAERGRTVLLVSSKNPSGEVTDALNQAYEQTDTTIRSIQGNWVYASEVMPAFMSSPHHLILHLNRHRYHLDKDRTTAEEQIAYYSELVNAVILSMLNQVSGTVPEFVWKSAVAFRLLLSATEEAGLERAIGGSFFAKGGFTTVELLEFSRRHSQMEMLLQDTQIYNRYVMTFLQSEHYNTSRHQILEDYRQQIFRNDSSRASSQVADWWFRNMTEYMDILGHMQDLLIVQVMDELERYLRPVRRSVAVSIFVLALVIVLSPFVLYVIIATTNYTQYVAGLLQRKLYDMAKEHNSTKKMLQSLIPNGVLQLLTTQQQIKPKIYKDVSVLVVKIKNTSMLIDYLVPNKIVDVMNGFQRDAASCLKRTPVQMIENSGDKFVFVCGCPVETISHASIILHFALAFRMKLLQSTMHDVLQLNMAISSGSAFAAFLQETTSLYILLSKPLETANSLCDLAPDGSIAVDHNTYSIAYSEKSFGFSELFFGEHAQREMDLNQPTKAYLLDSRI